MAQTENGVGISFKLADGTMVWCRRDEWIEVLKDVRDIRGEGFAQTLESTLRGGGVAVESTPPPTPAPILTPEAAAAELGGGTLSDQTFEQCPKCGSLKDKLVPAGTSARTGKAYKAFYACPTRGCPGK